MQDSERYWTVDLPGLSAQSAEEIADRDYPGVKGPSVVDPRIFLTLHLDADSVHALARAARDSQDDVVAAILEELDSWLRYHDCRGPR